MNDLVSIIMPSYNTANYINDSIRSVIGQTYQNWELIIVDDCSTDNTDEVISHFHDERIIYLKNEKNSGAAVSRNKALKKAKGKWVAFLDSDDLWESDKLYKQILFMESNGFYFSYTKYEEISDISISLGRVVTGPKRITRRKMFNYCWPGCLTVMYDIEKVGLIQIADIKKNNDYAIWLKVCKVADCYLLDEKLAKYRKGRKNSISNHGVFALIKWHYKLFKDCENENCLLALWHTLNNLLWGFWKKMRFVEKMKHYE